MSDNTRLTLNMIMKAYQEAKKIDQAVLENAPNPGIFMGRWVPDIEATKSLWDMELSANAEG